MQMQSTRPHVLLTVTPLLVVHDERISSTLCHASQRSVCCLRFHLMLKLWQMDHGQKLLHELCSHMLYAILTSIHLQLLEAQGQ